ncbi:MAG: LTA synthase family protein [Clostridia bacterium]|nr:LTA synthase family protein [Clostridia bacterium]
MKKILSFIENRPYKTTLILAAVVNVMIWCLHTRSLFGGIWGMVCHPISALYNALSLVAFYGIALFFRRRVFALSLISILWLGLGITDCVLLGMRVTPLQAIDFYIIRTGIAIVGVYMSVFEIILTAIAILAVIALLTLLFIKAPRFAPLKTGHILIAALCLLLALLLFSFAFIGLGDANPDKFDDICDGYDAYGFPYCFLRSVFDRGIDKPDNYSEETVRKLLSDLASREPTAPQKTPNIIFVQLESFFDVTRLDGVSFSEDPIPNFRALGREGTFGMIRVPGIGSGTVNTEFEMLTGLPLALFGTGEYPYESVLREKSCETVAYNLLSLGYGTHAFHNHTSAFYDRYRVYANLGFDDFTGAEYMKDLTYNALGWEKDKILTSYIIKALDSTAAQDFVFAVTVEGHGGYPEIPTPNEHGIRVDGITDEPRLHAYEYYVNSLAETDDFIGALKDELLSRDEETVLVLYGDHLPALDLTEDDFKEGDLLTTDYVIWSTHGLPEHTQASKNIPAYFLYPYTFSLLGIDQGLVPRMWQEYAESERYFDMLTLLGYDTLYGEALAYGPTFPFARRDMRLGIDEIRITDLSVTADREFFVTGEHFTKSSHVFVNGKRADTTFISENTLYIEGEKLKAGDEITVVQISTDLRRLSETTPFIVEIIR